MNRREFMLLAGAGVVGSLSGALAGCGPCRRPKRVKVGKGFEHLPQRFAAIEKESGGRLGVAVLDTATGVTAGHRAGERFAMCSTFKMLAVAATLARVDAGTESLERRVVIRTGDVLSWSPVTKGRIGEAGMSVAELCESAMVVSDNTAANLLLRRLGGPAGVTAFVRSLGDSQTRLDRIEPGLNEAVPGDPRDTTTPAAMLGDLRALTLGDALSGKSRDLLIRWLMDNKVGDDRIRAGVPAGWKVGDKTGSGRDGTANDVGIVWPVGRKAVLLSVYVTECSKGQAAVIASVSRAVAEAIAY